ncbi:uncharacterized protein LOC129590220 [Paramacrobiotus metropolitanus]|uniref:uncharacterized protein LOC129590220 n=1 Tax=Paramacrobiotus metropolitanus TaxID=2943436 RepID=UPI0024458C29|nr:uncharacterized protein LOC129590220 [Paramacrobiotus metropolitanus]
MKTVSKGDVKQTHKSSGNENGACHVVVHLMSADNPDTWTPPDGPTILPPKHIEKVVQKRYSRRSASEHTLAAPKRQAPSELQIRKDFFQIQNPKNAHHANCELLDFFRHNKREKALAPNQGAFKQNNSKGLFQVKQIYNPQVYEAMTEFISPMENYEFFSAFETFLAYFHNTRLIMRLSPAEDAVEIWSRRFAMLIQQLGETRPTSFHTIVVPMILKPVTADRAWHVITKEWRRTSIASLLLPPLSLYARAISRWVLPLTEPFIEDENGHLKPPQQKTMRLDVGYLFAQRRKFGRLNAMLDVENLQQLSERKNKLFYKLFHKDTNLHRGESVRNTVSQIMSTANAEIGDMQIMMNAIGAKRGSIRSSQHFDQSTLTIRRKKVTTEKLLKANLKREAQDRLYWLHYIDTKSQHLPNVFARMVPFSPGDSTSGSISTEEFFNAYYPITRREKFKEPKKIKQLLHPQFSPVIIREMIGNEISTCLTKATTTLKTCDNRLREIRKEHTDRVDHLETGLANLENLSASVPRLRIPVVDEEHTDVIRGLKQCSKPHRKMYLKLLSGSLIDTCDHRGIVKGHQPTAIQRQITGNDDFVSLQTWQALSNGSTNSDSGYPKPKFTIDAPMITISECTEAVQNGNPQKALIDPESDPAEEHCIFLRLVIDSGCEHFYFEVDDDWNEEDDTMRLPPHLCDEKSVQKNVGSRRRQSSVMVESMGRSRFDFFDMDGLDRVKERFATLKRRPAGELPVQTKPKDARPVPASKEPAVESGLPDDQAKNTHKSVAEDIVVSPNGVDGTPEADTHSNVLEIVTVMMSGNNPESSDVMQTLPVVQPEQESSAEKIE